MAKKKKEFVENISIMTAMTTQNQSHVQLVRLEVILTLHQQDLWEDDTAGREGPAGFVLKSSAGEPTQKAEH
jgi:hypothetical protein